jgi:ABC-2 type transport system permease protein
VNAAERRALHQRVQRFVLRTWAMAAKEVLHIQRDIRTLILALVMPIVMLFLFGYGVSFDIDHLPLAIADADHTESSRALVQAFRQSGEFEVAIDLGAPEQAEAEFKQGTIVAALVIPKGFETRLNQRRASGLQLLVDGADAVVSNQVLAKSEAVVGAHALSRLGSSMTRATPPLEVKVWTRYNPSGKSALFMVPGLGAYLLAISAVLLTALTVAGEWERGSMEQLFASPVGQLEIILGKLLPYLALGMLELLLVLAFGAVAFDVPMRGSLAALFAIGLFFLIGMLGQGLFISVVTRNQLVATQAGTLSALLPSMILSGMLYPIENMPAVLQWLSAVVPARYLVHALRGILLKGNGLEVLWPDLLAQVAFAVVVVGLACARLKRRIA